MFRRDTCWGNEEAIDNDPECSAIYSRAYISAYNSNVYGMYICQVLSIFLKV